jgi:hypothetical protein
MTVTTLRAVVVGVLVMMVLVLVPLRASAGTLVGTVMHVSTTDLAVKGQDGKTVRFVLVPQFNRIFSKDGKTTVQMTRLKPGTPVRRLHGYAGHLAPEQDRDQQVMPGRALAALLKGNG